MAEICPITISFALYDFSRLSRGVLRWFQRGFRAVSEGLTADFCPGKLTLLRSELQVLLFGKYHLKPLRLQRQCTRVQCAIKSFEPPKLSDSLAIAILLELIFLIYSLGLILHGFRCTQRGTDFSDTAYAILDCVVEHLQQFLRLR